MSAGPDGLLTMAHARSIVLWCERPHIARRASHARARLTARSHLLWQHGRDLRRVDDLRPRGSESPPKSTYDASPLTAPGLPQWLTGSAALNTSHPMYTWLYLFLYGHPPAPFLHGVHLAKHTPSLCIPSFNFLWVIIPAWLMWDSFKDVTLALRDPRAYASLVEREEGVRRSAQLPQKKVQ